jgi:hypothetical protein
MGGIVACIEVIRNAYRFLLEELKRRNRLVKPDVVG